MSNNSFTEYAGRKVIKPDHVIVRNLERESVLLNLENAHYYGLDDVGTRIYATLAESATIQSAYEAILPAYDVAAGTLQQDMAHLIEELVAHSLIVLDDA